MNKAEKQKINQMLSESVKSYRTFRDREDNPEKPCIRREVIARQGAAFNLASYLYHYGFITFEECCETWAKVDIVDEDITCSFENCEGCQDGVCKYAKQKE